MRLRARVPKHSKFEYRPRYYDPEREQREVQHARYDETNDPSSKLKNSIRQGFGRRTSSQFQFRTQRSEQSAASNRRLLIIIATMALLTYLVLEANVEGLLAAFPTQQ